MLESARSVGSPKYVVLAHLLLARAADAQGDLSSAREHSNRGIERLRVHPFPWVGWRLYELFGSACRRAGDTTEALATLAHAVAIVDQIDSGLEDSALRTLWSNSSEVRALRASAEALGR